MSDKTSCSWLLCTIISLLLIITIVCLCSASKPEPISIADPFRAAFIDLASAQNDPVSHYMYSEFFDLDRSCMGKCDAEVNSSFGLTDTYGDERKQLCYAQCQSNFKY